MRRALTCVIVLFLVGSAAARDTDDRLEKAAGKQKTKIAKLWLDLARYLEGRDLKERATDALARARALDEELDGLADVAARVEALAGAGTMDDSTQARIDKAQKDAAKGYDKLAALFAKEERDPRFAAYLGEALALDPSAARAKKLVAEATTGSVLFRSPAHPMVALVSFPKAWKPGREWPVLVSVEGAGCNFDGNAAQFRNSRGSRPFILVSPHALSCTNGLDPKKYPAYDQTLIDAWNGRRVEFDVAGLLAILDFLVEHFGASKQVAVTGFSGGGNLCYGLTLQHPERILCAAPACANFQPGLASGAPQAAGGGPPVHLLTGENDPHRHLTHGTTPPGIEEQTDWAQKALGEHGFDRVQRTMLPGVGHSPCPQQVWAFVDEVREET